MFSIPKTLHWQKIFFPGKPELYKKKKECDTFYSVICALATGFFWQFISFSLCIAVLTNYGTIGKM